MLNFVIAALLIAPQQTPPQPTLTASPVARIEVTPRARTIVAGTLVKPFTLRGMLDEVRRVMRGSRIFAGLWGICAAGRSKRG